MICTCNGVEAELVEYGDSRQTDAYILPDDTLILRTTAMAFPTTGYDGPRVTVYRIHHWFDACKDFGVMVVLPGDWNANMDLHKRGIGESNAFSNSSNGAITS